MSSDGAGTRDEVVVDLNSADASHSGSHGLSSGTATLTDEQRAGLVEALREDGSDAIADAVTACDSADCGACNGLYDMEVRDRDEEALAAAPRRPSLAEARPADSAGKAKWLDYLESLGADRGTMTGGSKHWDEEAQDYVTAPELTKDQLVELAGRLGG